MRSPVDGGGPHLSTVQWRERCGMWPRASRQLRSRILRLVHDELVLVASGECDAVETIVCDRMAQAAKLAVPLDVWVSIVPKRTVAH
jgi:hypothetical protein